MNYTLSSLIDMTKMQRLLDSFCDAMGTAAAIIDLEGEVLIASRWQRICTHFHRTNDQTYEKCIESDTQLANELQEGKPFSVYRCPNGLTDAASPIIIENEHMANAFAGQFFLKPPDQDFFARQAARYGFDEAAYLDAVSQVPIMDAKKLPAILNFLTTLAEITAVMGIDRLKQLEAEATLKEREEKLRTIIEHSNELFYIHDTKHIFTYVSQTSETLLGYTSQEMMTKWTNLVTPNPINQKGLEITEKAIDTGERQPPYLLELWKKDGTSVLLEIDESPVKDATGQVVAVSGAARDVTEQKQIEQRLLQSEKGFRDLFESITDVIYTQDLEGRFISVNPALCNLFGYEKDELIGKKASDFMKPQMRVSFEQEYLEQIKTKGYYEGISSYFSKTGNKIYIEYRSSLVNSHEGVPYISGTGRDVTERVLSQREIERLQKQILQSQKMEAIGLMAGGVAHDLNNILSGIVSYPELLLMDLPDDSPLRKPLQTIQESGVRAAEVVADLLTIARGVATGKETLDLNPVITEYLDSPEHQKLKETHAFVEFKTRLDPDLLHITGSSVHLKKTVMNLVHNAAEAIEGAGTVTLSTASRYLDEPFRGYEDVHPGEYTVLSVSDTGSGISPADMERIFEPFYTKKVLGRSGTGLGLSVVWNTIQDHNGYINVKSHEQGTTFELYFPVSRKEIAKKQEALALEHMQGHGEQILVVDDEKSQRDIACRMLTRLGYMADAVSSGEAAIEYVKKHPVDLIVLDMVMPKGCNGYQTYKEMVHIRPGQKAVIASGYAKTKEVDAAQALGAGKYIEKPYTLKKLGAAIKTELERI